MPNWCTTKLTVEGDAKTIAALKADCFTDNALDFNRILPMPPALDIEDGSSGSIGYDVIAGNWQKIAGYPWVATHGPFASREALVRHFEKLDAQETRAGWKYLVEGQRFADNESQYGYRTWYDWRRAHWGTKWNVCQWEAEAFVDEPGALTMRFDTAWSPALPILAALSLRYPSLSFEMYYADEGGGFAGVATAEAGEVEDIDLAWEEVMADRLDRPPPDDDEAMAS